MKKIIIYGVNPESYKTRRLIEKFLDDEYEIIGYSDGYYMSDRLDHKSFYKPEDLCKQSVDFILINTESNLAQKTIRRNLTAYGIPAEKIIRPILFQDKTFLAPLDLIDVTKKRYNQEKGLIFGLSYSANGINEEDLKYPFYDCSWSSLDLYYNFQIYNYLLTEKVIANIQTAWFVVPYYYFDYDLSLASTSNPFPLSALWRLNDWHHYPDSPNSNEKIENFKMFLKKMTEFFQMPKYTFTSPKVFSEPDNSVLLDPLWFTDHKATVVENKKIFVEFLTKLSENGTNTILIVPPFYLKCFNGASKNVFQAKKEKFYQILQELESKTGKIPVFDYADRYAEKREFFSDSTHLNFTGATEFTNILNKEVIPYSLSCEFV